MTAYLRHRLERAGVDLLRQVWIMDTHGDWLFQDLSAELATLFPAVQVEASSLPAALECDLAVIPYREGIHGLKWRRVSVSQVARARPRWVGLYEVGKRRLVIFHHDEIKLVLLRLSAERWIRAVRRVAAGSRRRLATLRSRNEACRD